METAVATVVSNQFEMAAAEAPPVSKKARGRPSKKVDPVKLSSFKAALAASDGGVSSSHLSKVTGLDRSEVMSLLKALIKSGEVVKTGAKKGSKYTKAV